MRLAIDKGPGASLVMIGARRWVIYNEKGQGLSGHVDTFSKVAPMGD